MLLGLALLFLCGIAFGELMKKIKLPPFLGMLVTGMLLGPFALDVLDENLLAISPELRKIALILILTRAGLNLNLSDLKKAGRPAFFLCFLPACFEIGGMMLFAPKLLGITLLEGAILGTVIAAVSPAVIVPKMLRLMEEGYGKKNALPQMIMAGAAVDDIFVIVLFTSFIGIAKGGTFSPSAFLTLPSSIVLGALIGGLLGVLLDMIFQKTSLDDSAKVLVILSVSFLLVALEEGLSNTIGFSGLIGVMALGIALQKKNSLTAMKVSETYTQLWVGAEVLLFVLVGATVDMGYAVSGGIIMVLLLLLALLFRMLGVLLSLLGTKLTVKERLFSMTAYCPKATVQAAIGGIPLAMGLSCGSLVLTMAVLAILITAPLGALLIDLTYKKWLDTAL